MKSAQDFLRYCLQLGAMELIPAGRKLKSGRLSYHFFNAGLFNTGQAIRQLALAYAGIIRQQALRFDVIFGLSYKGCAISPTTALTVSELSLDEIGFAFDRKEIKDHGEGGRIVGMPLKGKRVLSVDDVITTGDSQREAHRIILEEGGIPMGCVIAFDRQEYGNDMKCTAVQQLHKDLSVPIFAASTLRDLIAVMGEKIIPGSLPILEKILQYKKQYCLPD